MNKQELISYLENVGAVYEDAMKKEKVDTIFIYDKGVYNLKKKRPQEYKCLHQPYLRILWHEDYAKLYSVSENGYWSFMDTDQIKRKIKEYTED